MNPGAKGGGTRLQIKEGKLALAYPTLPQLQCVLMDLDENGCRGAIAFDEMEPAPAHEWQKTLAPRRPIHIRLDVAPFLNDFELDGTVSKVWQGEGRTHVELAFHHVQPDVRAVLMQAVLALATDKVRQSQASRSSHANNTAVPVPPAPPPSMVRPRASSPAVPKPAARPAPQAPAPVASPPSAQRPPMEPFEDDEFEEILPEPEPVRAPPPAPAPAPAPPPDPAAPKSGKMKVHAVPTMGQVPPPKSAPPPPVMQPPPPLIRPPRQTPVDIPVPAPMPARMPEVIPLPVVETDRFASKQLERAAVTMPTEGSRTGRDSQSLIRFKKLGEVLVHMGRLTNEQVESAVTRARANGERVGRYLIRTGMLAPDVLCRALALQTGLPMTDLNGAEIPESLSRVFTHELLMQYNFVPFDEAKTFVCIAVADPLTPQAVKDLERLCGKRIEVFLAQEDLVVKMLDKTRGKQKHKLRKHIRYELQALVRYQFCSRLGNPAEDIIHNGTTINVSEGGFLVEGSPTALGSPEDLRRRGICARVVLTGQFHEVTTICHLRSIRAKERQEAGRARWLLGLEIAEISSDDRRKLKELCLRAVQEKIKESD